MKDREWKNNKRNPGEKMMNYSDCTKNSNIKINKTEKDSLAIPPYNYAPLYQRFLCFIIDIIIIYGISISFALGLKIINDREWIMVFALIFSWIYLTLFYYKGGGQTIGSKIFGIKVISIRGNEIGFWMSLVRSVLISCLVSPLGFIIILAFTFIFISILTLNLMPTKQMNQTFWDVGTKTCVIKGGIKLKWNRW